MLFSKFGLHFDRTSLLFIIASDQHGLPFQLFLAHTENMYTLLVALQTARLDRSGRLRAGVTIPPEYDLIPRFRTGLHLESADFLLLSTVLAQCGEFSTFK